MALKCTGSVNEALFWRKRRRFEALFPHRYAATVMLLASLPPYPGASHDPLVWLERLMTVADKSREAHMMSHDVT